MTVRAETGLLSDALSTLCFLIGETEARPILERYGADAVFVYADKTVHATAGLRADIAVTDNTYTLEDV